MARFYWLLAVKCSAVNEVRNPARKPDGKISMDYGERMMRNYYMTNGIIKQIRSII